MLPLGLKPRLNRAFLGEYLAQMWIQEPDTMFEGVFKLPAGHWGRFRDGALEISCFWDLGPEKLGATIDAPLERLEALLAEAVALQLVADRPVGAYISGGVDSSLITHLAARRVPEMIAVSARLAGIDQQYEGIPDDGVWADRFAAAHPALRHHSLVMSADLYDQYKALIWHLDEPIADSAIVPAFLLAQKAREAGAIVMLSGMGGDELFGGYSRYAAVQALAVADALPSPATSALLAVATGMQRLASGPVKRKASHAQRFFQSAKDGWPISYVNLLGQFAPQEVDALAGPGWREAYEAKMAAVLAGFEGASRLVQAQRLDLKGFLASHNLIYSDKASMAASVEVRVPLLDYRLAEFAFALPDAMRATRGEEKVLLKQLCARMVGSDYAYRKKAGFAMPIRSWLRDHLRPEVERALTQGRIAALFDRAAMRGLLEDHYGGRRENTWKLWTLLNLDLWLERFDVAV
jgi:asparagine synthase (glutamine-hydrolysing)